MTAGDRLFGDMSQRSHAYTLGWVAAAGRDRKGVLELPVTEDGGPLLDLLRARGSGDIPISYEVDGGWVRIQPPLSLQASRWLGGLPGDVDRIEFPALSRDLAWAFLRGMLDASGGISSPERAALRVHLRRPGSRLLDGLLAFLPLPPDRTGKRNLHWYRHNALDLLGHLYEECATESDAVPRRSRLFERYLGWSHRVPPFANHRQAPEPIRWTPVHPDAKPPFKQRVTDSGYDLTLLYEKKRFGATVLYGTGLVVEPPFGWYLDVVPRSSIIKTGYLLANSVGVIDRGYRGELLVPLIKLDPGAPDLELPARVVQMVPRPIVHLSLERVDRSSSSHRGAGGFGSTG